MAKKPSPKKSGNGPTESVSEQGEAPVLNVLAQYIKDLSFENPGAPQSFGKPGGNPNLQVGVNVGAQEMDQSTYEVTIHFEAQAKSDDGVIYNIEMAYCGLFRIENVPKEALQPVLLVECPTLLFPFVRRLIADYTREGGFPPLLLDPIDFGALYQRNLDENEGGDAES